VFALRRNWMFGTRALTIHGKNRTLVHSIGLPPHNQSRRRSEGRAVPPQVVHLVDGRGAEGLPDQQVANWCRGGPREKFGEMRGRCGGPAQPQVRSREVGDGRARGVVLDLIRGVATEETIPTLWRLPMLRPTCCDPAVPEGAEPNGKQHAQGMAHAQTWEDQKTPAVKSSPHIPLNLGPKFGL